MIKTILFLTCLLAVSFVYNYYVVLYSPDLDLKLSKDDREITFYSGDENGFYGIIGGTLGKNTDGTGGLNIRNRTTNGGSQNAINVLTNPRSFGIVQEETVRERDFIRDNINYITPLYMERMHILYRQDIYQAAVAIANKDPKTNEDATQPLTIKNRLSPAAIEFFSMAKISTGPVGSGSQVLANYVLNQVNEQLSKKDKGNPTLLTLASSEAEAKISTTENPIHMIFAIGGAPYPLAAKLLKDKNIRLASISPAFIAKLNQVYQINLRMADFKKLDDPNDGYLYDASIVEGVSTFGSYAFLIASKDIRDDKILATLEKLSDDKIQTQIRNVLNKNAGIEVDAEHFQLKEIEFVSAFKNSVENTNISITSRLLTFIISAFSGAGILFFISTKFISHLNIRVLIKEVHEIQSVSLKLSDANTLDKALAQMQHIREYLEDLFQLENKVFSRTNAGLIYNDHKELLINSLDRIKRRLRKEMHYYYIRLESFSGKIDAKSVQSDYRDGYVDRDQYESLS